MEMFRFCIKVEPLPENPDGVEITGAFVTLWTEAKSLELAQKAAEKYLADYGWKTLSFDAALQVTPEQIARLETGEMKNCRKAIAKGTSAMFSPWPKIA